MYRFEANDTAIVVAIRDVHIVPCRIIHEISNKAKDPLTELAVCVMDV